MMEGSGVQANQSTKTPRAAQQPAETNMIVLVRTGCCIRLFVCGLFVATSKALLTVQQPRWRLCSSLLSRNLATTSRCTSIVDGSSSSSLNSRRRRPRNKGPLLNALVKGPLSNSLVLSARTTAPSGSDLDAGDDINLVSSPPGPAPSENTTETAEALPTTSSTTTVFDDDPSTPTNRRSWKKRFIEALPGRGTREDDLNLTSTTTAGDDKGTSLDKVILGTAIPSMINLAIVPLVNSVDTFWVGRMGVALALAGQSAANQAFFTTYFLVNYLPIITAPLVAGAVGKGNRTEARQLVCQSLFLCNALGGIGTLVLVGFPRFGLRLVLSPTAPAMEYAAPYIRYRSLGMIAALLSSTGFAAFRGMLDTVTPLKVSVGTNLLNMVLDPILIFCSPLGFVGAALATAIAEIASGAVYLRLLLKRKLARIGLLFKPPPMQNLVPLLQNGLSMLGRQVALQIRLVWAARRAQSLDPTGVTAAAYGIAIQMFFVGTVINVAMQQTTATLVPTQLAKSGKDGARRVADRCLVWGLIVGSIVGLAQFLMLPWLVPLFSPLTAVQDAVRAPARMVCISHVLNGPVFAGEGTMMATNRYRDLMLITACTVAILTAVLTSPLGQRLNGIFLAMNLSALFQAVVTVFHYLRIGPLAVRSRCDARKAKAAS